MSAERLQASVAALEAAVQSAALGTPTPDTEGWTGGALSLPELAELAKAAEVEEELARAAREERAERERLEVQQQRDAALAAAELETARLRQAKEREEAIQLQKKQPI